MTLGTTRTSDNQLTTKPLQGVRFRTGGPPGPVSIATQHLRLLGAEPSEGDLGVVNRTGTDGATVETHLSWSGADSEVCDEATTQAAAGLMFVHGRRDAAPRGLAVDYISTAAGVLGAQGVLAALIGRARGNSVASADVSLDRVALLSISQYLAAACADDDEAGPLAPGGPPFTTADGIRFELEALDVAVWADFWRVMRAPMDAVGKGWRPFQFRYATACAPIPGELHHTAMTRTWAQVQAAAVESGADVCRLHTLTERAEELHHGAESTLPWGLTLGSANPATATRRGRCSTEHPLAGFTVLEAGRRVQAPLAAHLLGLLGATVVRIEPPGGDPLRGMPPTCSDISARWLALNRGKDAVEIDIKSPADRKRLCELATDADVFLHNWAPGKAEQLGLDADTLSAANPGLVYAYTSGWAGRVTGAPMGTDFMVQARTAVGEAARPVDEPPVPSLMTLLDVLGGMLGAEAILAGLLARERSGRGVRVESSLLAAAQLLTAPALNQARDGRAPRRPAGFRHPLPTADGLLTPVDDHAAAAAEHAAQVRALSTDDAVAMLRDRGIVTTAVTTDLTALPTDPRFAGAMTRDEHGAVAVASPWRFR
ncbi:CoA transferase [Nocardia sp. NBC_01730]|uniref:CoA transferase n=1 Tax=Nocardia sp. NBC_01730 TaxID=2975998 RepID=UPI002E0E91F2|nr:CoA transferase [Nocardia sp. NBC_01730]